jgi:translation initiation factor 5A
VHITGVDISTGKTYTETCPSTHNMDVPNVKQTDYSLIDITDDGYLRLRASDGSEKDNLKVPEDDLGEQVRSAVDDGREAVVRVITALDQEGVVSVKEAGEQG